MYSKKVVFWASCFGMMLFGIALISLGSVVPDLRSKFQLDEVSSGTLFSVLPFGILAGSMIFGPVVDKYSYRILLSLSCIIMFTGFLGIAFAGSPGILKMYAFFIGLGGGAVNGATNALVSDITETNKGASLSLLGVFFAVGALGMPLVLGLLRDFAEFETILTIIAAFTLVTGLFFLFIKFPPPKQLHGFPFSRSFKLIRDSFLLTIAFFLFLQSSFEGILNNWTTTYLIDYMSVEKNLALYALSAFIAGMALTRILIGTIFISIPEKKLLLISFALILTGLLFLKLGHSIVPAFAGLIFLGSGLAAGFPVMLGITGTYYSELSGTAFSLVLFIALLGNITVNYSMGWIARNYGINHLLTVAFTLLGIMIILYIFLFRNNKCKKYT